MTANDSELLEEYRRANSEQAFATLVNRHLNLVYSAALRQVRSPQLAEEVAQSVFTDLSRNARQLKPGTILTAWLYQVTRRTAVDVVRRESRRQARERLAAEMAPMNTVAEWTHIEPILDEAMAALDETDRTTILLRFFENKSLSEVGATLGTSDDAAQKRVSRAVERLREFFTRRGITVGASGLVVLITANAVQAAPAGLAGTISTVAIIGGTTIAATTTASLTKAIAMTTLQKTVAAIVIAGAVGTAIYQAEQASGLRNRIQALEQQQTEQAGLKEQIQQLQRERDNATGRLAALAGKTAGGNTNDTELLRLRGELTRLRAEVQASPAGRIAVLKQKLEQMPEKRIPELQFLTEKDWANAALFTDLNTDDGVRQALSVLRESAINTFLNEMMKDAIKRYLAANGGVLPPDLLQLKPYFQKPVTDDMLQRYKLLQTGVPDPSADLVRLTVNVDEDYDSNHGMSLNGAWGGRFNRVGDSVKSAVQAFANDNQGSMPTDPSQLSAYLKTPLDAPTIQKYLDEAAANPPPSGLLTPALAPALKAYADANNGQNPRNELDLVPYLTTTGQKAAFLKAVSLPPEAIVLFAPAKAYAADHKGRMPDNPSDLLPYVSTPEQKTMLQQFIQQALRSSRAP